MTPRELVQLLFEDMAERAGYDMSELDDDFIEEWENDWANILDAFKSGSKIPGGTHYVKRP